MAASEVQLSRIISILLHPSLVDIYLRRKQKKTFTMAQNEVLLNGWSAVSIDGMKLFNGKTYKTPPMPAKVEDIKFPSDDPVVAKAQQYAKENLPLETYNHSMRVYYYGTCLLSTSKGLAAADTSSYHDCSPAVSGIRKHLVSFNSCTREPFA